ncbi:MAG TPA: DUF2950 family protein, partial [Phycisphaerales bacterium]|nr:DUF2950 family protein [Phycisphaerales bacterium]
MNADTHRRNAPLFVSALLAGCLLCGCASQRAYKSPEDAAEDLVLATAKCDRSSLERVLGPRYAQLGSGDDQQDDIDFQRFVAAVRCCTRLAVNPDGSRTLLVGQDDWPFPAPIVDTDSGWKFDTETGIDRVTDERVGQNELDAIAVCRAFVDAEREYAESQ